MSELIVIGGGFAGFWAAAAARRIAEWAAAPSLRISLVAPEPRLVIRPRLYEAQPERLAVDLRPLLAELEVTYRPHRAISLAVGDGTGPIVVGLDTEELVRADRVVVATGSTMSRPPVPGAERAFSLDTQSEAIAFDERLAEIAGGSVAPTVVVIGAGFTGIELALELRDRLAAHARGQVPAGANAPEGLTTTDVSETARIVLVDRAPTVGPELGGGPRPVIERALADAGVELRLGGNVTSLDAERVRFEDGGEIHAGAVVLCTGLQAASFASAVPGERDRLGRVIVDPYLRAPAAPQVFVAGDAAAADTGDGQLALQSCQHALQLGRVAGENAARDLTGLPLVSYRQARYVTCLDLGRSGAVFTVGWDRTVQLAGQQAKQRKRMINTEIIYPPTDRQAILRQSALDPAER